MTNSSRSALVTGAGSGIGEACVRALAGRGPQVLAAVHGEADIERVAALGECVESFSIELTEDASRQAAARFVHERCGDRGLDGLVSNAGIAIAGPLELLPLDELRRQLEVNVTGTLGLTQALLPALRLARGRIVNVSSLSGSLSTPFIGAYAASKRAREALSDALRIELRNSGVAVSVVAPAEVDTPIWEKSLARAAALEAAQSDGALSTYREDIAAVRRATERARDRAMPADRVAAAILHALTADRPRTRYLIGSRAKISSRLVRHLPARMRDWLVRRSLGLT